jgi:hypothetical protein
MYHTQTISLSGQISYDTRVKMFWTIVAISILSLGVYIYGVSATIRNTVARQDLEAQVANLSAEQSSLEFAYIEEKNQVDIDLAYARGFSDIKAPVYISRTNTNSLSYNSR